MWITRKGRAFTGMAVRIVCTPMCITRRCHSHDPEHVFNDWEHRGCDRYARTVHAETRIDGSAHAIFERKHLALAPSRAISTEKGANDHRNSSVARKTFEALPPLQKSKRRQYQRMGERGLVDGATFAERLHRHHAELRIGPAFDLRLGLLFLPIHFRLGLHLGVAMPRLDENALHLHLVAHLRF